MLWEMKTDSWASVLLCMYCTMSVLLSIVLSSAAVPVIGECSSCPQAIKKPNHSSGSVFVPNKQQGLQYIFPLSNHLFSPSEGNTCWKCYQQTNFSSRLEGQGDVFECPLIFSTFTCTKDSASLPLRWFVTANWVSPETSTPSLELTGTRNTVFFN